MSQEFQQRTGPGQSQQPRQQPPTQHQPPTQQSTQQPPVQQPPTEQPTQQPPTQQSTQQPPPQQSTQQPPTQQTQQPPTQQPPTQQQSQMGSQGMSGQGMAGQEMGGQQMAGQQMAGQQRPHAGVPRFDDHLTNELRIALDDLNEVSHVAEWCATECTRGGPQLADCARVCEDVAELAEFNERLIARDSMFGPDVAQTFVEVATEAFPVLEQHEQQHPHISETISAIDRAIESCRTALQGGQQMGGQQMGGQQMGDQQMGDQQMGGQQPMTGQAAGSQPMTGGQGTGQY